jgi:peptidoglycan/LPS O-acetylase OafA/YrhL
MHSSDVAMPGRVAQAPVAARAHASGEVRTYFPQFDVLRITLAIGVMVAHTGLIPWKDAGNFCVQVFFALSGWLIGASLLRTEASGVPRFFFHRATRIWIPAAVALALFLAVSVTRDAITPKYLEFVFYKLTFVYNVFGVPQLDEYHAQMPLGGTGNHFWSICAEEQFYLIAPLALIFLPRFGRALAPLAVACLGLAWPGMFGSIALGVLAAMTQRRFGDVHLRPLVRVVFLLVVAALLPLLVSGALPYEQVVPVVSIAVVLLAAVPGKKGAFGAWLGGISYPLYLNHWLGMFVGHALLKRFGVESVALGALVAVALGLAVAAVLYRLVDKPVLAHRDRWYAPHLGTRLALTAYALTTLGLIGGCWIRAAG